MDTASLKALAFDVFGTVVDWRGSVVRAGEALGREKGIGDVNWPAFADAWRGRYAPSMDRVRRGEMSWQNLDWLHRASLQELLTEFSIESLTEEEKDHLNKAWHRLAPWPDSVEGLTRLKKAYTITTLSNGNVALLNDMAKNAGLPWDLIFSAEIVRHYKPDPETYRMVPNLLDLRPEQVMLVAAHPSDLRAAQEHGLKTAYVLRPLEWGPDWNPEPPDPSFDVNARDFLELAEKLGA